QCNRVNVQMIVLAAAFACGLLVPAAGQQSAVKPPSLEGVFDKNTANDFAALQGDYVVSRNAALGKTVLTVGKNGLALQSKAAANGPREIRALVRLGAGSPSAAADFSFAMRDSKDQGLRFLLSTADNADLVSCQVQQDGKPLHDAAALAKVLDWE